MCGVVSCCVCLGYEKILWMCKGSYDDGWQVCLLLCNVYTCVNVLFFTRLDTERV